MVDAPSNMVCTSSVGSVNHISLGEIMILVWFTQQLLRNAGQLVCIDPSLGMAVFRANLAIGTRATRLRKHLFHVQTQPNRKGVVGGSGDQWRCISKGRIVKSCGTGTILC